MNQKRNAPGRWHGARANDDFLHDHSTEVRFQAAGSVSRYFVALTDGTRQPVQRLSGECDSLAEALSRLAWIRRGHPGAQIVRELLLREVLT